MNSDKTDLQTIDGATGKVVPTSRRIDLSSLRDVRLELAAVYRLMDSGGIPSQEGTRRAYVLKLVADVVVSAELERRIIELENQQPRPGSGRRARQAQNMAEPLMNVIGSSE